MQLLTPELRSCLPALNSCEHVADPVAKVKFFTPWSDWTWYVLEFDRDTELCFGLVQGFEEELGYFSLAELEEVRGPCGLTIERDLYFKPAPLSRLRRSAA